MGVAKSMTLRGGGGPTLSVTMTLIFPKIVWTCPLISYTRKMVPTRNVLLSAQMGERASVVLICIITSRYNEVK